MTDKEDIVYLLRKRAEIRRSIPTRRSVQENKADCISDLLEQAADEIESLRVKQGDGFWSTLEITSVASGFDYEKDYLELHKRSNIRGAPLSKKTYNKLEELFDLSMDEYFEGKNAE